MQTINLPLTLIQRYSITLPFKLKYNQQNMRFFFPLNIMNGITDLSEMRNPSTGRVLPSPAAGALVFREVGERPWR